MIKKCKTGFKEFDRGYKTAMEDVLKWEHQQVQKEKESGF